MSIKPKTKRQVLVALISSLYLLFSAGNAWPAALIWVGNGGDDDFTTAANWNPAQVPTASDTCTINSTNNRQPSILSNAACGSLNLGAGLSVMTLTFAGAQDLIIDDGAGGGDVFIGANGRITPSGTPTGNFDIGGSWSDNIGTTNFTSPNLHLNYSFTGTAKTISTDESFYNLNINGDISLTTDLTIANSLTISNTNTLTQGANTITHNGSIFTRSGTYNHSCASTLEINGSLTIGSGKHFPNVIINSGGTLAGSNGSFIDCDITIENGGTFTQFASSIEVGGNWTRNTGSIYTALAPSEITMTGAGKQIGGTIALNTFPKLTIGNGAGDSVSALTDIQTQEDLTVTANSTFTLQNSRDITTDGEVIINGTMNLSGTSSWAITDKTSVQVNSGGLLSAQGTDSANRVTFTRNAAGLYDLLIDGGMDFNYVNVYYTTSGDKSTSGFNIRSPGVETMNFDNVAINYTEDVGGAVMLAYDTARTLNATGITFDSSTYTTGDDYNVEALSGTINLISYGGNYGGEADDNDNGGLAVWLEDIVSGTVYTDEGTSTIADGNTVRLLVNGASAGTDTTSGGTYSITAGSLNANDTILIYIDNDDGNANDGTTVTVSDGSDLSALDIYVDHFIVRHDNAGSMTNALLKSAVEPYVDTEILYSVDGSNNLTVSGTTTELYIPAAHTYTPGANVDSVSMKIIGTAAAGSSIFNVSGNWSNSGTFTANTSSVILDGTDQTISGSTTFNNLTKVESSNDTTDVTLTFDNTATQTITGILTLDGLDGDDRINLVSDSPTNQWDIVLAATASKAIDYIEVTDSDASGSDASLKPIDPVNSIDGGNNVDWFSTVNIVKEARLLNGTLLGASTTLAAGSKFYFVIYVDNTRSSALIDSRITDTVAVGAGNFTVDSTSFEILNNAGTGIDMTGANIAAWAGSASWLGLTWDGQTVGQGDDYLDWNLSAANTMTVGLPDNTQLDIPVSAEADKVANPHRKAFRFIATINP